MDFFLFPSFTLVVCRGSTGPARVVSRLAKAARSDMAALGERRVTSILSDETTIDLVAQDEVQWDMDCFKSRMEVLPIIRCEQVYGVCTVTRR